jgi:hypothetical protein
MTLESSFGHLLTMALTEWCEIGRYDGRRLDDVLFNEYDPARDNNFGDWLGAAQYADYQPGAAKGGEPIPRHRSLAWPVMVIQTAIYAREPERIAQILADETKYELETIAETEWVDEDGNPARSTPDQIQNDQRIAMGWASNWRRTFGVPAS